MNAPKKSFKINKRKEEIGKNKNKIVKEPIKAPNISLFKEAFLFKVLFTVSKRTKSKNKFKRKTRST